MILGQDSSNHIGPLKTLPPEYFVCIYWENLTKFSAETYEKVFMKNKMDLHYAKCAYIKYVKRLLHFSVLSSHQNCKKHTLKQNRAVQVGNKHEPYIIPFLL